jgi:hypothetical protein
VNFDSYCYFHENKNSNATFTLSANALISGMNFAQDVDFREIYCPGSANYMLQSLIFDSALDKENLTEYIGVGIDPTTCTILVDQGNVNMTLSNYYVSKHQAAKGLCLSNNETFVVNYSCRDCGVTSKRTRALGLITVLCSFGSSLYGVLIACTKWWTIRKDKTKTKKDLEKANPISAVVDLVNDMADN